MSSMVLRCKIEPSLENMDFLNRTYGWLPDRDHIRPSPAVLEEKRKSMECGEVDINQWSLDKFGCSWDDAQCGLSPVDFCFEPNKFPYDVPEGTHHYVLWFPQQERVDDDLVTSACGRAVFERGGADFAWYINPKMTFPHIYHVQVFWRK